ncbi:AEC family transporter [Alkalihalobacterium chitinilyticum]|uniref:AEC family transporter n=1 Tax=Alkalihalobacterium chitinilyticum TaxID=2980103 RepID=A0ABT5VAR0_9BACI|nr:AEC family transporter [Alkalihalobacterium chitinilyticum]MDE5412538.1 AEC family transporter [Alkalihalobacterium chitinilyticum]
MIYLSINIEFDLLLFDRYVDLVTIKLLLSELRKETTMDIYVVATSIMVMGIIIAIGATLAFKVEITTEIKHVLILIILNIAVPSIILNGVFNTEVTTQLLHQVVIIFGLSVIFHLGALLFAWILSRLLRFESTFAKKMTILAALGNTGFIGIPLCATIFGPVGGLLAAIFDAGLDIVLFSVVIYMLQSEKRFQFSQLKALINIPLLAIIIGLTAVITGVEPPQFLRQLTSMLSALAAPLAMLYIGMLLPPLFQKRGFLFYKQIWFPLGVRLLIIPIVTMLIISLLPLDYLVSNIVIILSAMPTIMLATVLFARYSNDEELAVITTVYSTLLSLLTIPLIAFIVSLLN